MGMILILLTWALQDDVAAEIRKLSADSVESRGAAADALVARGRPAIPFVRKLIAASTGDVKAVVSKCLERIDRAEVRAVLDKAGHKDLDKAVVVTDEVFAKLRPFVTMHLLPTTPACQM
jgi:hypothetical protein